MVGNGVGRLVVGDGVGLLVVGNRVGLLVGGRLVGLLVVGRGVGKNVGTGAAVGVHGPKLIRTKALAGVVAVTIETTSIVNALVVPAKLATV